MPSRAVSALSRVPETAVKTARSSPSYNRPPRTRNAERGHPAVGAAVYWEIAFLQEAGAVWSANQAVLALPSAQFAVFGNSNKCYNFT